jgi:hypothetical protein
LDLGCVSISTGLVGLPLAQFGYPTFSPYPAWSLEHNPVLRRQVKAALRVMLRTSSLPQGS